MIILLVPPTDTDLPIEELVNEHSDRFIDIPVGFNNFYDQALNNFVGIHELHGKTVSEAKPLVERAIAVLGTKTERNMFDVTAGNAGYALTEVRKMMKECPDGVFLTKTEDFELKALQQEEAPTPVLVACGGDSTPEEEIDWDLWLGGCD